LRCGSFGERRRDLARIPKRDVQRIIDRIAALADDPRPRGCEKLSGRDQYRLRQCRYRIGYSIQDEQLVVCVVKVTQRGNVYR